MAHTIKVFQRMIGRPKTASGNCDRQQKARREAGLIDERDVRFSRSDETIDRLKSQTYLASLAICAVRRETLRLALFL